MVGIGVGVLNGERGLAQTAETLQRGDDAQLAERGRFVQSLDLRAAADESRIVAAQVARRPGDAAQLGNAVSELLPEVAQPLADV